MARPEAWMERLRPRAGPLFPASLNFLREHPGAPDTPFPRGVRGLLRLARAIDSWAEQVHAPSADDEAFVEGAGALLGVVLLDHFGRSAQHRAKRAKHRVQLGHFGFFDPFGSIDRAMAASDARTVLVRELEYAESQAAASDGPARAARLLATVLYEENLGITITDIFEADVTLSDETSVDLRQVVAACQGESETFTLKAVRRLVAMIDKPDRRQSALTAEQARARLMPRLITPKGRELGAGDFPGIESLCTKPVFNGALRVALVVAYEDRARFVRLPELHEWSLDFDEALTMAIRNLAQRSQSARLIEVDSEYGTIVQARIGDGFDSSRLLLPSLHEVLSERLGSPFLAAIPHRDALFACARAGECEMRLKRLASSAAHKAPHRITEDVFLVDERGPRLEAHATMIEAKDAAGSA